MILPPPHRDAPRLARLATLVALAALPAVLVVGDRWLDVAALRTLGRDALWCRVPALCRSDWPSYMALAWLALALVVTTFVVRRLGVPVSRPAAELALDLPAVGARQARLSRGLAIGGTLLIVASLLRSIVLAWRMWAAPARPQPFLPSWELALGALLLAGAAGLALVPVAWARAAWMRQGRRWRGQAVVVLAGVAALWAVYTHPMEGAGWALALAIAAVALVWRDLRASGPVFWLALLAGGLASLHLTAWWRVIVGDEFSFYYDAADLAFRLPLGETLPHLFDASWVYGTHPFLSTLAQAIGLRVLGDTVFGWRFQDVLVVAAALPLLCATLAAFGPRRLALLTGLFLTLSPYLAAFAKIGYDNLHAYLALALVLAAAALAVRSRRRAASLLLGLALGACFHTFPAALYIVPLPALLMALYDPPTTRAALLRWATVGAGTLALAWPALAQPEFWSARWTGTLAHDPQLLASAGAVAGHVSRNLAYAAFSWLYAVDESHFVVASHADPVTGTLAVLGLGGALTAALRRDRFALFMLASGAVVLLLAGASHDKIAPPNTRMFLAVPWYAWLAAVGTAWLLDALAVALPGLSGLMNRHRRPAQAVVAGLVLAALAVSYTQAYPLARRRLAWRSQPMEAQFVRLARRLESGRDPGLAAPLWLFAYPVDTFDPDAYRLLARLYQLPPVEVATLDPWHPESAPTARELAAGGDVILVVRPDAADLVAERLGAHLRQGGYVTCDVRDEAGGRPAVLWVGPELRDLCRTGE